MNKCLARLVLEHGQDIFPLIKLLSKYVVNHDFGEVMPVPDESEVTGADLTLLIDSGLVERVSEGLRLTRDDRWLYEPSSLPKAPRKSSEPYTPEGLEYLAETLGAPADYFTRKGKYLKLYRELQKNFDDYEIDQAAEYFVNNKEPDWNLNLFLTKRAFKNFLRLSAQSEPEIEPMTGGGFYD